MIEVWLVRDLYFFGYRYRFRDGYIILVRLMVVSFRFLLELFGDVKSVERELGFFGNYYCFYWRRFV